MTRLRIKDVSTVSRNESTSDATTDGALENDNTGIMLSDALQVLAVPIHSSSPRSSDKYLLSGDGCLLNVT